MKKTQLKENHSEEIVLQNIRVSLLLSVVIMFVAGFGYLGIKITPKWFTTTNLERIIVNFLVFISMLPVLSSVSVLLAQELRLGKKLRKKSL